MFSLKYHRNSPTENRKIVNEDLSPILKENQTQNYFARVDSSTSLKIQRAVEDSDDTKDLISKLHTVNIDSEDTDDNQRVKYNNKDIRPKKKVLKINDKPTKVCDASSRKENIGTFIRNKELEKPKARKTKRTTKKKDSFIVSDNSSLSNDSVTLYHRVLSENIRADVQKVTPRVRLRKSIANNDDGIFTPYIFGKRSSSESSFSDKENDYDENPAKLKLPNYQVRSPLFPSTKSQNSIIDLENSSDEDEKSISSEFPVLKPKNKFPTSSVPVNVPKTPVNFLKDLSWIFTDDDSSSGDEKKSRGDTDVCNDLDTKSVDNKIIPPAKKGTFKKKTLHSNERTSLTPSSITFRLKQVKNLTPKVDKHKKEEPLSFLESLSTFSSPRVFHPEAEAYKKKFKKMKGELALKLFKIFNEQVFDNQLPSELKIEWSARLRSSSGLCYNRRIKTVIGPNNECLRASRIALSTKIIETPDRLRDTLIHEMCHAAAWIVDNTCDGHGPRWKSWASKAMKAFPELPLIRRCHDYSVKTKYKYTCVKCGYTIGRHSKSLNLERKRCGYCYGKFKLISNHESAAAKFNAASSASSPKNVKARPLSKFALFVKENYGKIKSEKPDLKHGDIMKELSKNFSLAKISN